MLLTTLVRRLLLLVIATSTFVVAPGVASRASGHGTAHHQHRTPKLVERELCAGSDPGDVAVSAPVGTFQHVTVRVRPTAQLRIDRQGKMLAAMTNTGCAPRPTDDLYYVWPSGHITPAPARAVRGRRWMGDFRESGTFVRQ